MYLFTNVLLILALLVTILYGFYTSAHQDCHLACWWWADSVEIVSDERWVNSVGMVSGGLWVYPGKTESKYHLV